MLTNYIDVGILEQEDVAHVMSYLFGVVHGIQRKLQLQVALDFPGYQEGAKKTLGKKMRIWGSEADLLQCTSALEANTKVNSYAMVSRVKQHNEGSAQTVTFTRVRLHSKKHRAECFAKDERAARKYPFVTVKTSGGQTHAMRIRRDLAKEEAASSAGTSTYGLSSPTRQILIPYVPE